MSDRVITLTEEQFARLRTRIEHETRDHPQTCVCGLCFAREGLTIDSPYVTRVEENA